MENKKIAFTFEGQNYKGLYIGNTATGKLKVRIDGKLKYFPENDVQMMEYQEDIKKPLKATWLNRDQAIIEAVSYIESNSGSTIDQAVDHVLSNEEYIKDVESLTEGGKIHFIKAIEKKLFPQNSVEQA